MQCPFTDLCNSQESQGMISGAFENARDQGELLRGIEAMGKNMLALGQLEILRRFTRSRKLSSKRLLCREGSRKKALYGSLFQPPIEEVRALRCS